MLGMSLTEYTLLAASSLFVIVDPLATIPAFLAMTPTDTPEERIRMARLACCVMAGVLIVFSAAGKWIFKFLGITMPAFQLAASVVLLLVALDMRTGAGSSDGACRSRFSRKPGLRKRRVARLRTGAGGSLQ